MKTLHTSTRNLLFIIISILILTAFTMSYAQIGIENGNEYKPETQLPADVLWDVKAYMPEAILLKVKAIDANGKFLNIKALQSYDDTSILDVKAIDGEDTIPVKLVIDDNNENYVLKAIKKNGEVLDVKAITDKGVMFPVHGIFRSGNTIMLRGMADNGKLLKVFAISPEGQINLLKGIKMNDTEIEATINGVDIYAHVKALHQIIM